MNTENLTIVVDGGASGCRLAAFNQSGTQCASAQDGPASLSIGEDKAWQNIRQGLASLAEQVGESKDWLPNRLWMGLAGSLQSARYERFLSLIPDKIAPVVITDGHAQLLGATGGQPGACLAIGTGSVLHWLDTDGNYGMAGGWGYPVGDEGSGAWLGMQLVNYYLWHCDKQSGIYHSSNLFAALERRIGTQVSEIQLWSTSESSTDMASLAPIVVAAANQGDKLANKIVERGINYCQELIDIAPEDLPIYLVGGLSELYEARLKKNYGDRYQPAAGNALSGLYTYATAKHENKN